jgi:transcriptional regulator with XRE-family HTH domain
MVAPTSIDTRWFQGRLMDRQISQRKLAKHLGLDPAAVSLMLRGKRKATAQEVAEIARTLGVGVDEVMARLGTGVVSVKRSAEVVAATAPAAVGAAIGSDTEFLMKWMELGNYLLQRR